MVSRSDRWTKTFVILGLALRAYHYLRDPSMWHDEASVVINILDKSYPELLGPLRHAATGPPLFLWAEHWIASTFGDSTYVLRLIPFLASCAALLGIVAAARRLLTPNAVPWVALLVGCSDRLLWHACEAKPYATDILVGAGIIFSYSWARRTTTTRVFVALTFLAPPLIFLSYPGCFVLAGAALAFLPALIRERSARAWLAAFAFATAYGLAMFLIVTGPVRAQQDPRMLSCWASFFPDWQRPWSVPGWVLVRTTEMARYAFEPIGNALAAIAVVGAVALWRTGERRLVAFLLLPMGLTVLASLAGKYPIGPFRVVAFLAPAILFLVAAGMPVVIEGLRQCECRLKVRWSAGLLAGFVAGVVLIAVGGAGFRVWKPWDRADTFGSALYVLDRLRPGDTVAANTWEHDYYFRRLGETYSPLAYGGLPKGARCWCLIAAGRADLRDEKLDEIQRKQQWTVQERHEFDRISVILLEKQPEGTRSAGVSPARDGRPGEPR